MELKRFNVHEDSDFTGFLSFVYLNENQMKAMSEDVAGRACKALNRIQDACVLHCEKLINDDLDPDVCKMLIVSSTDYAMHKSIGILDFLFMDMGILELDNYDELMQWVEDNYKVIEEESMKMLGE